MRASEYYKKFVYCFIYITLVSGCTILENARNSQYLESLQADAIGGNVASQIELADLYANGGLVEKSPAKAIQWYKIAADNGAMEAVYKWSVFLRASGSDRVKAQALLERAVEGGYPDAQIELAEQLIAGNPNNELSLQRAFNLYLSAADQDLAYAQRKVGEMLLSGTGVDKNYDAAFLWMRRAAYQGEAVAQKALGDFYLSGLKVNRNLDQAFDWYLLSAEQGSSSAQSNLGDLLTMDRYPSLRNFDAGHKWYRLSAAQGNLHAITRVGELHEFGSGVVPDAQKAAMWYRNAAEQGAATAQCRLGSLYLRGEGVAQNDAEAERWFKLAGARAPAGVQPILGFVYYDCNEFSRSEVDLASLQ